MRVSRPAAEDLSPDKPMTDRQYRYIKVRCADHLMRAESVARAITDKDLADLNQSEAHQVIQYLEEVSREGSGIPYDLELEVELGRALTRLDQRSGFITDRICVLALLATNRVATPGQLARYAYGVVKSTFGGIARERIARLLEGMLAEGVIGRAGEVKLPLIGKGAVTDVYYLAECGSDELHLIASQINYHARPGLPPHSRLQHELAVTEARLDIQLNYHIEEYLPETKIRSDQEKERRKRRRRDGEQSNSHRRSGCGDFQAWVTDVDSGQGRRIEVEVTIRARRAEINDKPRRIKVWYAAAQHRCDLIELSRGEFARLIPDVREPLDEAERTSFTKVAPQRATVSDERVNRILNALERMGGAGTPEALAVIAGMRPTTASEALALLAEKGWINYRDGFPISGKQAGRSLRLYRLNSYEIHSVYEFARLLTASKLVSTGIASREYSSSLQPYYCDSIAGIMLLAADPNGNHPVIAVVDDLSAEPQRVANWARAARQQAAEGTLKGLEILSGSIGVLPSDDGPQRAGYQGPGRLRLSREKVMIVTADEGRAICLRDLSEFKVVSL